MKRTRAAIISRAYKLGYLEPIHKWTQDEIDIVKTYYPIEGKLCCKRLPDRSTAAILSLARKLKIQKNPMWSTEDDQILMDNFPIEGKLVYKRFNGKFTDAQCSSRAHILGLKVSGKHWSDDEDMILRTYYPTKGYAFCLEKINEMRSADNQKLRTKADLATRSSSLNLRYLPLFWSDAELAILREYYPIEGSAVASRLSYKSEQACVSKACELNIRADSHYWSDYELEILRTYFPTERDAIKKRLPNRSKNSIRGKAIELGMRWDGWVTWTDDEIRILSEYFPTEGGKVCDRFINKSKVACQKKAKELGLELKIKKNYYAVQSASKKCYCIELDKTFNSIAEAKKFIGKGDVWACLAGKQEYAGMLPDGTKLHWKYIDEEN